MRISAQLIDAITGGHHWAERYDRELGDIFAVQDEITSSVVAAIELVYWPRKAFARFRAPRKISAPGSSWLAPKRMSGV